MATVSFNGLGSGIDFSQLTEAVIADRMRPVAQMQSKSAGIKRRSEELKSLNALLVTLTTAANNLTNRDLGTGRTASSSDSSVAGVTATSAAGVGKINLGVTRLATNLIQSTRGFAASTDAVLAGGATSATFELRQNGASTGTAITINAANNSLDGLRQAINGANAGVTATTVDTTGAGNFQLALSSNATGTAGRVELVETTSTGTAANLNLTRLNAPTGTPAGDYSYLDAQFSVNGLTVTRATNQVSDAVTGLTFNLQKIGNTTVDVNTSSELPDKLQAFVTAYNAVQDFANGQYKKDDAGRPTGVLAGDATLRSIQRQLRDVLGATSQTNGGTLTNLAQIGIGRDNDGRLTFDRAAFDERLKDSFTGSTAIVSSDTARVLASLTGSPEAGTIDINTTRLATAYTERSASYAPGAGIRGNFLRNTTFQLQIGGTATGPSFTISSSNDSLIGLRDAINAANGGATASIVADGSRQRLVLTSNATGASNRVRLVETTSPTTNTGSALAMGATSAGGNSDYTQLNSLATVNGQTVSRENNVLADVISGVSLTLTGTGAATVTVDVTKSRTGLDNVKALLTGQSTAQSGLANSIHAATSSLSDGITGVVQTAINGYQESIKTIDKSIASQLQRLTLLRQSLTRQFAAADAAINQLNGQGTQLTTIIQALQPRRS